MNRHQEHLVAQENVTGRFPVTDSYSTDDLHLYITEATRTQYLSLSPWLPNRLQRGVPAVPLVGQTVHIQLCLALKKRRTEELCNCRIRADGWFLNINNGRYKIVAEIDPSNAIVTAKVLDCGGCNLPPHIGQLSIVLPVGPLTYQIDVKLILTDPRLETAIPAERILDRITFMVRTHTRDIQSDEVRDTRSLMYLETPLRKLKLNGILLSNWVRRKILEFEKYAEEGMQERFKYIQRKLDWMADKEPSLSDVVLVVLMEEGLMAYLQGDLDKAIAIYERVCKEASNRHSTNYYFIVGRTFCRMAAVYRRKGDLSKAAESLENSSQLLEGVCPCEHTSDNRYNMAALCAERLLMEGYTPEGEAAVERHFDESLTHLRNHSQLYSETSNRGIRRVANREISVYLRSSTRKVPDTRVEISEVSLARASEKIERFRRNLLPECPKRDKAVFHSLESDFLVRKGEFNEALEKANMSLSIAEELGLKDEMDGAVNRSKFIESLLIRQSVNAL